MPTADEFRMEMYRMMNEAVHEGILFIPLVLKSWV
jgi:hypothetical protein